MTPNQILSVAQSETDNPVWRPALHATPPAMRLIVVSGGDSVEWTMVGVRAVSNGRCPAFGEGVELGMNLIKSELLLPLSRELTVQEIMRCFASATVNRRNAKLSRILYLVRTYPGAPLLHKGLRFVAASLWAAYAALGVDGEEGQLQSTRINEASDEVWKTYGWKTNVAKAE
jgi:hypothetical protein